VTSEQQTPIRYTHKENGGLYHLVSDAMPVDGLDHRTAIVLYVRFEGSTEFPPQAMTKANWDFNMRPLQPLECHHCLGKGHPLKAPKKVCGYCNGSTVLDAQGNAITSDNETADQLKTYITDLRQRTWNAERRINALLSTPGIDQFLQQNADQKMRDAIYPSNNNGPFGATRAD